MIVLALETVFIAFLIVSHLGVIGHDAFQYFSLQYDFLNNAVNPWLTRFEKALSAWFPRSTYVKFNTNALLRSD